LHRPPASGRIFWTILLVGWAITAAAKGHSCKAVLGSPAQTTEPLSTLGVQPATADLALTAGHAYLVEVEELDNDARVEILDAHGKVRAHADHPERRTGTRRLVVTPSDVGPVTVRITGQEHASAAGTATVRAFDLSALQPNDACLEVFRSLAVGDAAYATGQEISRGRSSSPGQTAREAYLKAEESYASAERLLADSADTALYAQTALALAGVEYFGLQNWSKAADWGGRATAAFGNADPYRRARAQWITDLAWMEIGSSVGRDRPVPGQSISSTELLNRTRNNLEALGRFHLQRHENYDAAMALINVQLIYELQARHNECLAASAEPARLFDELHETARSALVLQNRALCLWGLGRLPEALVGFEHALTQIEPELSPGMYLAVLTNTALLDYALGHFDESLQLYDRALTLAQKTQWLRDEAYCLYGVGVNYAALGDEDRAREFLERSLAIRTVALDGRGRMTSLRELATVEAAQGRFADALKFDREALTLTVAPSSIALIRIQLAVHTAAAGQITEAKAQLDELLAGDAPSYPLIRAEARLQRAIMERKLDQPGAALADLHAAQPQLHRFGSVTEEFEASLELARTLRLMGQPEAALQAVERALRESDAVRLQTVNPELRSLVQTPLRAAYDLKIELLRARYEDALAARRKGAADRLAVDAFVAADASRAHSFSDVAAQEYSPAMRRELAAEFRRREALYRELAARRYALADRLQRASPDDPRVRHLMSDITELERQADTVNTAIAARTLPKGTQPTATRRLGLPRLPADTALVSYWLGAESAYAWVVVPDGIRWVRLSSPITIANQAVAFHHSLSRIVDVPAERRLTEATALYESVLRPIESPLSGDRQWVMIPDGALDYVPFAALRSSDAQSATFVALQHDVALTPAAWRLNASRMPQGGQPPRGLLLVADPVYQPDDPRLVSISRTSATPHAATERGGEAPPLALQRLPYTAEEAAGIAAEFPRGEVEALTGVEATRARLLALDWSKYRYIHIAAHGIVDAQVPQLSALILGAYDARGSAVDGAVRVADLSLQRLRADVAVFSACDTALGREVPSEGLVGISSTVLARGANAVVASLWPVSDEIGARLMTEFYRHLLHDSMSPAAALGAAMRSVVSRDGSADPALWAAFQISVSTLGPGLPTTHPATTRVPTPGREESQ
jgi:CHAT domain-containing protein